MSVKDRLPKVRQASKQVVLCLDKSPFESVYGMRSLSDPSVNYQVRLQWNSQLTLEDIPYSQVSCECHKVAGVAEVQPDCKGNINGTICYHSLASLVRKAEDKGQSLSLFDSFRDAVNFLNFGGKLVKVVSAQSGGFCWAVVSQRKRSDLPGDGGLDKINFELSPEEQRKLDQERRRRQEIEVARERRRQRIEMMRGPVETGID